MMNNHIKINSESRVASFFRRNAFAYCLILPTVLYILIFQFYPIMESIRLSFTDTHLVKPVANYIGFKNYMDLLFDDDNFWKITGNSFIWIGVSLVFQMLVGLISALILNQNVWGRGFFRGLSMVPWVMPIVVVGLMIKWMVDLHYGIINTILMDLGFIDKGLDFLGNKDLVWITLIATATWKGFCYPSLMLLAGLKGISDDVYEAAQIDGAVGVKKFFYITLPLLKPVMFVTGIVQIITGWTKFEMIWVLTNGGPGYSTSILPTYIYTNSFQYFKMGLGSAVAVISMVILVIFILVYYKVFNKTED